MKLKNKNVMVTGGAGFIGSHLVDRIARENPANLIVVDSFFLGNEENLIEARKTFPGLKLYRMDASNLAAMLQLVISEKIEVVFDLAVIPLPTSLDFPTWTIETNIGIASTFCELARRGHIQTLVHCSSSEAYGSAVHVPMNEDHPLVPCTPYAASKAACDHIVLSYRETYNIDAVVVRPFNNFGPRQNPGSYAGIIPIVVRRVLNKTPIEIFDDGEQTRDFIFVRDTVEAMVRIYEEEKTRGQVINISSGVETSMNTLVSQLTAVMHTPDHPVFHSAPRPGDVRRHCGDVTRLKELTGFEPRTISVETLIETAEWYRSVMQP
ncbi:MAG: NAD-dependent epimerase/dehydratase family protein [Anaerolineales bacterium]|nr:NAD-dependent epimerase/dehydratase family protein [Anaerolineales bacterium]